MLDLPEREAAFRAEGQTGRARRVGSDRQPHRQGTPARAAIWLSYAVSGGSAFLLCGRRHIRYWLPERENRLLEDLPELGAMEW
ncbi:MAG TPA: hypothetical protein VKI65_15830 [Gemmataceae bacterium]|nr:hypothetical protein [Gemmataceae bacterium]